MRILGFSFFLGSTFPAIPSSSANKGVGLVKGTSKCGPLNGSINIIWELIRSAAFGLYPNCTESNSGAGPSGLGFPLNTQVILMLLKFENFWTSLNLHTLFALKFYNSVPSKGDLHPHHPGKARRGLSAS